MAGTTSGTGEGSLLRGSGLDLADKSQRVSEQEDSRVETLRAEVARLQQERDEARRERDEALRLATYLNEKLENERRRNDELVRKVGALSEQVVNVQKSLDAYAKVVGDMLGGLGTRLGNLEATVGEFGSRDGQMTVVSVLKSILMRG